MQRKKILNFPIHQKRGKLYAVKRIKSKVHWIYIGDDLTFAEDKIRSYCQKKEIEYSDITPKVREKNLSGLVRRVAQEVLMQAKNETQELKRCLEELEKQNLQLSQRVEALEIEKIELVNRLEALETKGKTEKGKWGFLSKKS